MKTQELSYTEQADKFAKDNDITLTVLSHRFGKHFEGEKENRRIFTLELARNGQKYVFDFGQSLNDSLKNVKDIIHEDFIDFYFGLKYEGLNNEYLSYSKKIKIEDIKKDYNTTGIKKLVNQKEATDIYNNFVKSNTSKYVKTINIIPLYEWLDKLEGAIIRKCSELKNKNFGEGIEAGKVVEPTMYDILTCLTKYDPGSFEKFCDDFGYNNDSRKAEKTYKEVVKEWEAMQRLFTPDILEAMQEIQ